MGNSRLLFCVGFVLAVIQITATARMPKAGLPQVYRKIELNQPQMFVDDYLVGNRFNDKYISARVPHVLHRGERLPNPILAGDSDKPWEQYGIGGALVFYDAYADIFRMYYKVYSPRPEKMTAYWNHYSTCQAVSKDGLHWEKPLVDLFPWGSHKKTNIILRGRTEASIDEIMCARDGAVRPDGERVRNIGMLTNPKNLKGHRFVAYYRDGEHYLATSQDGVRWKKRQQMILHYRVDCSHTIVYDPALTEYVTFYRNKVIYDDDLGAWKKGNHRMITRLASSKLWTRWDQLADTVIIPDDNDAGRFYGMPTFYYGGVYWGMLQQFAEQPETIEVELVWSRDGFHWQHEPGRSMLIPIGKDGTWDDGMILTAGKIIERNDQWWLYYSGHDGYHDSKGRQAKVGLIKFRKEGFVSIRADIRGRKSYIITRPILWPGGELVINTDASKGYVKVAVTDVHRKLCEGFNYEDCVPFTGDNVRHKLMWKNTRMSKLKGKLIRLEFEFKNADIYAFLAAGV